jgi:hypothetical protein
VAYVQHSSMINFDAAATKQLAMGSNLGAGNGLIVIAAYFDPAGPLTVSCSDTRGHSYSTVSSGAVPNYDTGDDAGVVAFYVPSTSSGANTITVNFGTTSDFGGAVLAIEDDEIANTTPFIVASLARQAAPGTTANALSPGNANVTSQPAILYALSFNNTTPSAPAAGTGMTDIGTCWVDGTAYGRVGRTRRTATGNYASTFTAVNGASTYYTLQLAFAEEASGGSSQAPRSSSLRTLLLNNN